jgi:hypothetical protein
MLQWLYMYVARICFIGFRRMLQVFYLDVAYVSVAIYICCKRLFKMFICFRRMMQLFYLDVANVAVAIHICCKRMLQIFYMF